MSPFTWHKVDCLIFPYPLLPYGRKFSFYRSVNTLPYFRSFRPAAILNKNARWRNPKPRKNILKKLSARFLFQPLSAVVVAEKGVSKVEFTSNDKERIRHQFDAFCKKVVKYEAPSIINLVE